MYVIDYDIAANYEMRHIVLCEHFEAHKAKVPIFRYGIEWFYKAKLFKGKRISIYGGIVNLR